MPPKGVFLPCIQRRCQEYALPGASRCEQHEREFQHDRKVAGATGHRGSTWDWRRLRREVWANDRGVCQRCLNPILKYEFDVHHVNGDANDNRLVNLQSLHRVCHRELERELREARRAS